MENLNITKGKWVIVDDYSKPSFELLFLGEGTQQTANVYGLNAKANADLICEAGNVANETGLTPRELLNLKDKWEESYHELLNQRNELLSVLYSMNQYGKVKDGKFTFTASEQWNDKIQEIIANTTK